jgi:hypothetical protein
MASRPYQARHYLQDPQDQAAYLNEVLTNGDDEDLRIALTHLAQVANLNKNIDGEWANFSGLAHFFQSLGLRLTVEVVTSPTPVSPKVSVEVA